MPQIAFETEKETYLKLLELKGDKTWREVVLEALGLDYEPRQIGRPPRNVKE